MVTRFPWLLTLVVVPSLLLLVALGGWQMQRLGWKNGLIEQARVAATLPRAPLRGVFGDGQGLEFRRVSVACRGLDRAPFVEMRSIADGEGGVRLYSLCRTEGFAFPFLVDRGFVADGVTQRPEISASTAPITIEGELREVPQPNWLTPPPNGRSFYAPDPVAMPRALGEPEAVAPMMIFATTSTNPEVAALKPSAPPAAYSNNHLGYAITWFGLAIVLVGFYVALLVRKLKKEPSSSRAPRARR